MAFTPTKNSYTRVFLIDGRARPDHKPAYQSNMAAGAISRSSGDIEKIEIPSSSEFGKFEEVGSIRGADDRPTISLSGRYAADLKSELLKLVNKGCTVDVQIIIGACTDPTDYNTYTKKIIFENAYLTSWDVDEVGALSSDDQASVGESAEVSGEAVYEVVPASWAERAADVVTNEVLDVAICDVRSCGDCEDESDGCQKFYAITKAAGGSASTPADVVFTLDGGTNFYAHDIDTLGIAEDPDGVECLGDYLVVVSEDSASLHYCTRADVTWGTDPAFTEVTTGFVGGPRCVSASTSYLYIAGASGYIYRSEDPTSGVTVLDSGSITPQAYNDIHAADDELVVAGANAGVVVYSTNGTVFTAATNIGGGVNINAVWAKSKREWFAGGSDGNLYYTLDAGVNWTVKGFPGSGSGSVESIYLANDSVMYITHTTAGSVGRVLKSTNGGYDFKVVPEGVGSLPTNQRINAIVACKFNPDLTVAVGLGAGTDGIVIVSTE